MATESSGQRKYSSFARWLVAATVALTLVVRFANTVAIAFETR